MHLEEVDIACQHWEFLAQEAECDGEARFEGELKRILLSKLAPDRQWVEVCGVRDLLHKMEVRKSMSKVSSLSTKEITNCERRWKSELHDGKAAKFFSKKVHNKITYMGTFVQDYPWVFN